MDTIWIIIIDVLIALLGRWGIYSIFPIIRYFAFTLPFTNFLIEHKAMEPDIKKQLLFVEIFSSLATFIIINGLCILGAYFTTPSGFIVYGIVAFLAIVVFPPSRDRYTHGEYCVNQYLSKHSACINIENLKQAIKS